MEAEVVSPLKAEAEPRVPCVPRREPGNENGARVGKMVPATTIVWFPGSRQGTSMIYRLGLKAEAEPRVPCVPRREPGNELPTPPSLPLLQGP